MNGINFKDHEDVTTAGIRVNKVPELKAISS
jgi:hypothetical protein